MDAALVLACGLTPLLAYRAPMSVAVRFSVVLVLAALCLARLVLSDRGPRLFSDRLLFAGVASCGAAVLVSALASPIRIDSLLWGWGEGTSAAYWLSCLLVFAACAAMPLDVAIRRSVSVAVAVVASLGGIALVQRLFGAQPDQLVGGGSNYLGTMLVLCLPVALGLATTASTDGGRRVWRAAAAALTVCALSTGSAAAQVTALAVLVGVVWAWPSLMGLAGRPVVVARVAATAVAGVVMLAVALSLSSGLPARIDRAVEARVTGVSLASRLELWRAAAGMAAERPLMGWGPDGFEFGVQSHTTRRMFEIEGVRSDPRQVMPQDPHSFVMTVLVELGVLGLIAFGFTAYVWIRRVMAVPDGTSEAKDLRLSFALGVIAFCGASLAVPWATSQGLVALVFAGLAIARPAGSPGPLLMRPVAVTVAVLGGLAAVWLGLSALTGAAMLEKAFANAVDARVLSAQLASAQRTQPSTLRAYQRLWADANRVGVDLTTEQFVAMYQAAPEGVRGYAPYATTLTETLLSRDTGPAALAFADATLAEAAQRSGAYPDPLIVRARVLARSQKAAQARELIESCAWSAELSKRYPQGAAEVQQLTK